MTVRSACANRASVVCRYPPVQRRTSSWSKPTSPLAVSTLSSIAQRVPATRTISATQVSTGPQTTESANSVGGLRLRRTRSQRPQPGPTGPTRGCRAPASSRGPLAPCPALKRCQGLGGSAVATSAAVRGRSLAPGLIHRRSWRRTATTQGWRCSSSQGRQPGSLPYPAAAVTQGPRTPAASARASRPRARCGLVAKGTASGTPASRRRSPSAAQLCGRDHSRALKGRPVRRA
jgi:hypothetical protein